MTVMRFWTLFCLQLAVSLGKLYNNQFAVHIPNATSDRVERIADKYGFTNLGQIGTLEDFYLFEHSRIHKRSTDRSHVHHQQLNDEPDVLWFEQQVERRRVKRDFALNQFQPSPNPFPDPFYSEQWYLHGGGEAGFDMNVLPAWKKGYTGKGIVVSILDDGIQRNHPDLAQNYDPLASTDINDNDDDPMPRDNGDNKHGTRCAGEVAAVAFNNFCGVGIAFNSSIGGVRMLDGTVNDAVEARALSLNPDHVDIYSASWGPEDDGKTVDGPGPLARRAFINGIMRGRKGKGSIFVWASGNGGRHEDSCNCDGYTNSIFTLSISSATQGGFKPWYLEECSSTLATTYSSGRPGIDRSIATVDMDGSLRPDFLCTSDHTGTSASAPLAAGIIALALEANPNLTWRDMQHLVVFTSRPDPLQDNGWVTNGIGKKVSHKFGYGLMDAGAMVTLAEQWTTVPPQHVCQTPSDNTERPIPSEFGQKLEVIVETDACAGTAHEIRYLEHIQCRISLRYAPRGNLRIRLTSPSGTPTVLLFERPRDVLDSSFEDWPFMSVHFWGERAAGRWKLEIINAGNRRVTKPGILKKWQLVFYGTDTNPVRLRQAVRGSTGSFSPAEFLGAATVGRDIHGFTQPALPLPSSAPIRQPLPFVPSRGQVFFPGASSFNGNTGLEDFLSAAGSEPVTFRTTVERIAGGNETGKAATNCPRFSLNGKCVNNCPSTYYTTSDLRCEPCHPTCVTCAGPGPDHCVKCADHFHKTIDKNLCVEFCPETYHQDEEQKLCIPCTPQCKECSTSALECSVCEFRLVLHNSQCLASCPEGFYEDDDYACNACHSACATCRGPDESHCVACALGYVQFNGTCVKRCPPAHWDAQGQCLPCPQGCLNCPGGSVCSECDSDWVLDKTSNLCVHASTNLCHDGEYANGTKCFTCHPTCSKCDGESSSSCTGCPANKVLHQGTCLEACPAGSYALERQGLVQCVACPLSCEECKSADSCVSCLGGLHMQDGRCLVACEEGYYTDRGICVRCHESCSSCTGPLPTDCLRCSPGKAWLNHHCLDRCPTGYLGQELSLLATPLQGGNAPFSHDVCVKCDPGCKSCLKATSHCTSCYEGFTLNGTLCSPAIIPVEYPSEVFMKEAEGRGIRAGKDSLQEAVTVSPVYWILMFCIASVSLAAVVFAVTKVRRRVRRVDFSGHGRYTRVAVSTHESSIEKLLLSHSDLDEDEIEIHSTSPYKI